jgi:hypothetical protein
MKTNDFKILIKQAVKEAIQEELKDILLEAIRSPKTLVTETLKDNYAQPSIEQPKKLTPTERQAMFGGILGEMQNGGTITQQYAGEFQPKSCRYYQWFFT